MGYSDHTSLTADDESDQKSTYKIYAITCSNNETIHHVSSNRKPLDCSADGSNSCSGGGGSVTLTDTKAMRLYTLSHNQVWPLTQLFLFPFLKKTLLICLEGKSLTLYQETLFPVVPLSNSLVSVSEGF